MDAYFEHVGAAVRAGGGTVVKFEGDAALIVFSTNRRPVEEVTFDETWGRRWEART